MPGRKRPRDEGESDGDGDGKKKGKGKGKALTDQPEEFKRLHGLYTLTTLRKLTTGTASFTRCGTKTILLHQLLRWMDNSNTNTAATAATTSENNSNTNNDDDDNNGDDSDDLDRLSDAGVSLAWTAAGLHPEHGATLPTSRRVAALRALRRGQAKQKAEAPAGGARSRTDVARELATRRDTIVAADLAPFTTMHTAKGLLRALYPAVNSAALEAVPVDRLHGLPQLLRQPLAQCTDAELDWTNRLGTPRFRKRAGEKTREQREDDAKAARERLLEAPAATEKVLGDEEATQTSGVSTPLPLVLQERVPDDATLMSLGLQELRLLLNAQPDLEVPDGVLVDGKTRHTCITVLRAHRDGKDVLDPSLGLYDELSSDDGRPGNEVGCKGSKRGPDEGVDVFIPDTARHAFVYLLKKGSCTVCVENGTQTKRPGFFCETCQVRVCAECCSAYVEEHMCPGVVDHDEHVGPYPPEKRRRVLSADGATYGADSPGGLQHGVCDLVPTFAAEATTTAEERQGRPLGLPLSLVREASVVEEDEDDEDVSGGGSDAKKYPLVHRAKVIFDPLTAAIRCLAVPGYGARREASAAVRQQSLSPLSLVEKRLQHAAGAVSSDGGAQASVSAMAKAAGAFDVPAGSPSRGCKLGMTPLERALVREAVGDVLSQLATTATAAQQKRTQVV